MGMEKESFQTQVIHKLTDKNPGTKPLVQTNWEEEDVSRVALPTQLPALLDLSPLPEKVQRSGAIEALIQQNEDLMARLSVAIRRSALVEDKIGKYESTIQQLKDRNEVLADQLLVYREKDRLQENSHKKYEKKIHQYKENLSLLEVQYAEYFATSKERQRSLTASVDQLSRRLGRHLRYRAQIQRTSRQMRKRLKAQIAHLNCENKRLEEKLQQEDIHLQELRGKLSKTVDHIQRQAQEAEANQRQLVEDYEKQFTKLKLDLKEKQALVEELEGKVEDFEKLHGEKVFLQNQLVALQRLTKEKEEKFNQETHRLQVDLVNFRREAKEKTLEVDRLTQAKASETSELEALRQAKARLEDQVESLQCLWRDTNNQLEVQSKKNKALQKLNQQLSTSLNERRKEAQTLRKQMDGSQFRAADKIKDLKGQVKALGETNIKLYKEKKVNLTEANLTEANLAEELKVRHEAIERIKNLMAEIQSGFSTKEELTESTDSTEEPPSL